VRAKRIGIELHVDILDLASTPYRPEAGPCAFPAAQQTQAQALRAPIDITPQATQASALGPGREDDVLTPEQRAII
jgi:hypothetical protein